jgi:N-6 DNA methylase family protein
MKSCKSLQKNNNEIRKRLDKYTLEQYKEDIENYGLETTWNNICDYIITHGENDNLLNINNFGEMYKIGLALVDKQSKKESGQYFTPDDIALVMGKWLNKVDGYNVCDVACGTENLILTY